MDANDQNRLTDSEMRAGEGFMAIALAEAKKAEGRTHPNPCVGVVIVKAGRIVGKGTHEELLASCPEYQDIARSQLSEKELAKGGRQ